MADLPDPRLLPREGADAVSEEQLWSWVDRDAAELEAHLAAHPEDRGRVDELRRAIRAVASSGPERVPSRIGPYPIVRRLGSGGMGVVFEAEQVVPRRAVALKVIRGAWLDDERTRRLFRREADVLGRLQHPGIAAVFDAGETKEGAPYIVMELVDGLPIDRWAAGRTRDERLCALEKVARAVHHAHGKGVIHRDLKPSNVLVTGEGDPKVLDFGLARIVDPTSTASLTAALSGKVIGTVRYMSPEQASGYASRVTPASDVFSLGVLAYEVLVGRSPHDLAGKGFLECARTVVEVDAVRPTEVDPRFDPALERVLCKALARDPLRRYGTAAELADELARVRRREEVFAEGARHAGFDLSEVARRGSEQLRAFARDASAELRMLGRKGRIATLPWLGRARMQRKRRMHTDGTNESRVLRLDLNPVLDAAGKARARVQTMRDARAGRRGRTAPESEDSASPRAVQDARRARRYRIGVGLLVVGIVLQSLTGLHHVVDIARDALDAVLDVAEDVYHAFRRWIR